MVITHSYLKCSSLLEYSIYGIFYFALGTAEMTCFTSGLEATHKSDEVLSTVALVVHAWLGLNQFHVLPHIAALMYLVKEIEANKSLLRDKRMNNFHSFSNIENVTL